MRHRRTLAISLAMGALLALVSAGCTQNTPIRTLLNDPTHYDQKIVSIAGTVKTAVGVLGYGAYQVDDGTGTLTVLTTEGGAPREGAKVSVSGEFRTGFTVGTETAAVLMEKERQTK